MPDPAKPMAARASRIDPAAFLWLLACIGLATMNAPADLWATLTHLRVPDPDDAMRLVEVRDLLDGQGWYDLVQHRFDPPGGVLSHWSRLVDAPIAGLILALAPLAGRPLAEGLAAVLWPCLLFGLYGLVLYRGTRATFGTRAAILAVVVATQTMGVTVQFAAGRVDHHDVQLTAILGLALAILRGTGRSGLAGGLLAALSLAVGLEGLPFVAVGALYLTGDWALRGRPALPALIGFGLGLGIAAPILFGVQTDPARWGATACDALSPPWLYLAEGGLLLTLACGGIDRLAAGPAARCAAVAVAGATLVAGFAALFPTCLAGPFTGMSALVHDHWLVRVNEMTSAATFLARGQWEALVFYLPLLVACLAASRLALSGPHRRAWSVAALMLWSGLILGILQFRGLYVASGMIPLVAGAVIDRALAAGPAAAWRRWGAAATGACLVSSAWIAPAALGEALLPWTRKAADPAGASACLGAEALAPLAALPRGTVLAPIFMGPAILLHTEHAIVAAPYHRALPGLTAAIEGLGGTEADLRRATDAFSVRYLVACPARAADDLQAETAFATRLARGTAAADWLEPVPMAGPLKAWRVVK